MLCCGRFCVWSGFRGCEVLDVGFLGSCRVGIGIEDVVVVGVFEVMFLFVMWFYSWLC